MWCVFCNSTSEQDRFLTASLYVKWARLVVHAFLISVVRAATAGDMDAEIADANHDASDCVPTSFVECTHIRMSV